MIHGYNFRGSNSAIFIFASFFNWESTLKGKILILEEKVFPIRADLLSSWDSNRKPWKLFPFASMAEKREIYPFALTHCILLDSSTVICWMSPFVILGVSGLLCHFYSIF